MKVLYVLSQKPGNTGSGIYLKYITKEALKYDIDVRIIVGISNEKDLDNLSHIARKNIFPVFFGQDIPFKIAGMSDVMPYPSTIFSKFTEKMFEVYCNGFQKIFSQATHNWTPDIVHSNHLWITTALAINRFKKIPVITSCHGTSLRQKILSPFIEKRIKHSLQKIDIVLALTENQKKQIINWLQLDEKKLIVTGSGYANDIFCLPRNNMKLKNNKFKIIYAGKISFAKGVPYLVEAFKRIDKKLQNEMILYLAGDYNNSEGEKIRNEIIKENLSNVFFIGKLSQEKLSAKFKECSLFVLPSFFEGLPLVVMESLACGCNVIVSELPDLSAWINKDLIKNDYVKFIPLPKLKRMDQPVETEIEEFIMNLKKGITYYAEKFFSNNLPDSTKILNYINEHSFENLFKKIFKIYINCNSRREK